jgi:hypothetical protein
MIHWQTRPPINNKWPAARSRYQRRSEPDGQPWPDKSGDFRSRSFADLAGA